MELAGAIIVLLGSIFLFLGALGLLRMPDSFNRIQAGTKASTLGTLLSLAGLIFLMPGWWGKLLVLMIFIILTNPVSSHVLARAAYYIKTPLTSKTVVDKYKDEANPEMDNHKTEAS
ncbi:Mrp complex subunit G1 [Salinivirga cyanobacteriivorans]|uniref:Mrp complex subunit G1 n=1 Tax=Salinivirga cyanobacteriivorans TaxID=1307839 RepID=A0A0S2I2A3_9BACT|nr:monovalent cation/H(+) antiporter subunit G [Salinivirga cyanobacteriivorans]ALO16325.1 Mrp complex subunit G1 [Salinivirga cyanobacteriivorans]